MAAKLADIKLDLPSALNRVNMEENARISSNFADFGYWLQYPGFIIREHYADQPRFGPYRPQNIDRIDQSAWLRSHVRGLYPKVLQLLRCLQDSGVLNRRRDKVIARMQQSEQGSIIALCAARIEHHLGLMAVEELRQRLARSIQPRTCLLAIEMDRRGVAKQLNPIGTHRVDPLR